MYYIFEFDENVIGPKLINKHYFWTFVQKRYTKYHHLIFDIVDLHMKWLIWIVYYGRTIRLYFVNNFRHLIRRKNIPSVRFEFNLLQFSANCSETFKLGE